MKHLRVPLHSNGPALWPAYIPLEELERRLQEVGTPIFETMYQGRRGGLAGEIIQREYFRYGKPPKAGSTYMTVDPAISQKASADETAILVGRVTNDGRIFIMDAWSGRVGITATVDKIVEAWRYYRPIEIGIESVAYQASLLEIVSERYPELPIVPVTPDRDKVSRFYALGALYEWHRIVHHPLLQGTAFELQLTRLPKGKHDDLADALSYLTLLAGVQSGAQMIERPEGFR